MLTRRHALTALGTIPLAAALSACGTTEPAAPPATPQTSGGAPSSGPITITDGRGQQVTVTTAATKVVALEWSSVENLLALGVTPLGVADVKGFRAWDDSVELSESTTDVGMRGEPSVDSIATLVPDLIIGGLNSIPDAVMEQMARIAPIALFKGGDANRQLEEVTTTVTSIASLTGKQSQGQKLLADLTAKISATKEKLAAAPPYIFIGAFLQGSDFSIRVHAENSLVGAVAKEVGLSNAWTEAGDAEWGLGTTDLEGLTKLNPAMHILYWENDTEESVLTALQNNAVWKSIPAIQAGRFDTVAEGTWPYGGPASLIQWCDDLVDGLTND